MILIVANIIDDPAILHLEFLFIYCLLSFAMSLGVNVLLITTPKTDDLLFDRSSTSLL